MNITEEQVRHVARLARLQLTETETTRYTTELGNILTLVAQLDEVDASDLDGLTEEDTSTVFRPDIPTSGDTRSAVTESILLRAPKTDEHYFEVPKILDEQ